MLVGVKHTHYQPMMFPLLDYRFPLFKREGSIFYHVDPMQVSNLSVFDFLVLGSVSSAHDGKS